MQPYVLTIGIPSIPAHLVTLKRLLACLSRQIDRNVQVVVLLDNGDSTIGTKRQRILNMARGEYTCYIDSDDRVPDDYIAKILKAAESKPDCIGFQGDRLVDGKFDGKVIYSLKTGQFSGGMVGGAYLRFPHHLTPIRTELARACGGFASGLNFAEDEHYSRRVVPLLNTQEFIQHPCMYSYDYVSSKSPHMNNGKDHIIDLTVNVCSIVTRNDWLEKCLDQIVPQLRGGVEVCIDIDSGDVAIGTKRQRMLEGAAGRYVCSLDDDDRVSPRYLERLLAEIRRVPAPDYVSFNMTATTDGSEPKPFPMPQPTHLNPVVTEIAKKIGFKPWNAGEDNEYRVGLTMCGLIGPGSHIDEVMYSYDFRTNRDRERRNEPFAAHERRPAI